MERACEANLGHRAAFIRAGNVIIASGRGRKNVCASCANRWHMVFIYCLLKLEVLAHRSMIVKSGNDAPKAVPDKSAENGLIFRMAVAVNLWTRLSHFAWHRYGLWEVHEA